MIFLLESGETVTHCRRIYSVESVSHTDGIRQTSDSVPAGDGRCVEGIGTTAAVPLLGNGQAALQTAVITVGLPFGVPIVVMVYPIQR